MMIISLLIAILLFILRWYLWLFIIATLRCHYWCRCATCFHYIADKMRRHYLFSMRYAPCHGFAIALRHYAIIIWHISGFASSISYFARLMTLHYIVTIIAIYIAITYLFTLIISFIFIAMTLLRSFAIDITYCYIAIDMIIFSMMPWHDSWWHCHFADAACWCRYIMPYAASHLFSAALFRQPLFSAAMMPHWLITPWLFILPDVTLITLILRCTFYASLLMPLRCHCFTLMLYTFTTMPMPHICH